MVITKIATRLMVTFAIAALSCHAVAANNTVTLRIPEDRPTFEFVGQFNNTSTTSQQFGYFNRIQGLASVFSGDPQNETTALFTYVTDATTDATFIDGPLKIIDRTGTTTVYINSCPCDFTNPESFAAGTVVQVSTYTQQVVVNTTTNEFTTVHLNTITETESFTLNGVSYNLGEVNQSFRTSYLGGINSSGAPSGWTGGYAVGVKK